MLAQEAEQDSLWLSSQGRQPSPPSGQAQRVRSGSWEEGHF